MPFATYGGVITVKISIFPTSIKVIKFVQGQDWYVFRGTSFTSFVAVLNYVIALRLHHAREA